MHYYEVAVSQIIRQDKDSYTYAHESLLADGTIVRVEIGKKQYDGVILRETNKPTYAVKPIQDVLHDTPLPHELLETTEWISQYYSTHLAIVLQTILPRGLSKTRRESTVAKTIPNRKRTNFVFTDDQLSAIDTINSSNSDSVLLHGVTGSGKTQVYIEASRACIEQGKSVIILVPEIALTSQLVAEFSNHFSNIILAHSRQTESQRHQLWAQALKSNDPIVVIGPRSALFMPLASIGLIVVDECHEAAFKQDKSPRYSALRVASILAKKHGAKLVLGSATPSITDYYLAKTLGRPIVEMSKPAMSNYLVPSIKIVDMTKRENFRRHRFLSDDLLRLIAESLAIKKQILIFHNRRGSATTTLCEDCGWQAFCPRCLVPLALHSDNHELRCHICNISNRVPTSCPDCAGINILHKGIGTKLIETEITKLFPDAKVARFDGDNQADATVDSAYQQLYDGDIDIIIGTQVVAKGLDLPHLRTVGVIQADAGLSIPDYSSSERTFQLLSQVVGRVGRNEHKTDVVVQSYQPTHPSIVDGVAQDYANFYEIALSERRRAKFPPFVYLLKLTCVYKTEAAAIRSARTLAAELKPIMDKDCEILGPTPCFYERVRDTYRWQLIIKSPKRSALQGLIKNVPATHWQIDLDASSLV
ncbi:MAG: primosomal protein N' [Candidatus Saccharimonadaceae bacterium]